MTNRKIKIALNASMLDNCPTGVGIYTYNIINSLAKLNWASNFEKFTVFSPTSSFLNKEIKVAKLSNLMLSSQYGKLAASIRFLWNTFLYPFKSKKYDLVISTTTHGSFFSKNQIITIHDLLSLRFNTISAHQRLYFKYLLPFMMQKSKCVIAISETTKNDIVEYLGLPAHKIHVISNGYDNTKFYPNNTITNLISVEYGVKNYFLAIGPTYPHKNFELLIAAYNKLSANEKLNHPLVIVGGKQPYLKLSERVIFLDYVPDNLMPFLYREAKALVFPSLYEGFGMPPLEAMACGCPVIASDTPAVVEVCEKAALYINPHNQNSITNAFKKLINDADFSLNLKEKGLMQAKKFSWAKAAQKLKILIEEKIYLPTT
jgi:glycosyltransferase involved in cell wall biosynthesis